MRTACWFLTIGICLITTPAPSTSFSEDTLQDFGRWPHLQQLWLQLQNKRVTTPAPIILDSESQEVLDDEKITTTTPNSESHIINHDVPAASDSKPPSGTGETLTIAEAKEKLRNRRIKSRRRLDQLQQELELYQLHRRMETSTSIPSTSTPGTKENTADVKKHIQMMARAVCSRPAPRLVYVRDEHQMMPNVRYLPGCTWLHRCSDDVGCCPDESKICSPAHVESVKLSFFVLTMTGAQTKRAVTRLTFENHTSCECTGRNSELMPRTEPIEGPSDYRRKQLEEEDISRSKKMLVRQFVNDEPEVYQTEQLQQTHVTPASDTHRNRHHNRHRHTHRRRRHYASSNLRCPADYSSAPVDGKLQCVCQNQAIASGSRRHRSSGSKRCDRLKRGLDVFSARDRKCINESRCRLPSCDYGRYVTLLGRCPKREEWLS